MWVWRTYIYIYKIKIRWWIVVVMAFWSLLPIIAPYPPPCSSGPEINWAFTMPFSSHMWAQHQQSRYWPLTCLGHPRVGGAMEGMEGLESEEFFNMAMISQRCWLMWKLDIREAAMTAGWTCGFVVSPPCSTATAFSFLNCPVSMMAIVGQREPAPKKTSWGWDWYSSNFWFHLIQC